jgi:ADP-ribosylglycohydrolase
VAVDSAPDPTDRQALDRALGALYGLALGDALGMPSQELPRARAEQLLGAVPRLLPAGRVTDDTEQALLLGRLLVDGDGTVTPLALADALLAWQQRMAARGSLDLLGPTTRRALAAIRAGADPAVTGTGGATNGAAMRIAPVRTATPPEPDDRLRDAVAAVNRPTYDSPAAHAAATAVAAVVSLGTDGASFERAWPRAVRIAGPFGGNLPDLIRRAIGLAAAVADRDGTDAALD